MNRLTVGIGLTIGLALAAGQLDAQEPPTEEFQGPTCELDEGHFLVRQAITFLTGATEELDPATRETMLVDAQRVLQEAVVTDQAENPAVWYYYGRYYVLANDLAGADSAFARVEAAVPECGEDIEYYRHSSWVRAVNRGIDSLRAGLYDGAIVEFTTANEIWHGANVSLFYLGSIYADYGDTDSALYYFKRVNEMGTADTAHIENYHMAVENIATLHSMLAEWDSAIVWYERVRELDPGNTDAVFGMAEAYAESGNLDRAFAIYDSVLANPAEMNSLDVFNAGVKLFNAEEFDRAANAFTAGLETNPFHRDALYNLCNTYLAIANDVSRPQSERDEAASSMADAARRLIAVDPQNRDARRLLAAAHQLQGDLDAAGAVMDEVNALAYEVVVDISRPISGGYELHGRLINTSEDAATQVPALTFEFLDGEGNVLGTDSVAAANLEAGATTRFSLGAAGEGIVAWRYAVGS